MKYKMMLFNNVKFVGELNKRGLLAESIMLSVFDMLLAVENKN